MDEGARGMAAARAYQALAARRWAEARAAFEEALAWGEVPELLEGLATAAMWLDDVQTAVDARAAAFRHRRDAGDVGGAVRAAVSLAVDLVHFRGDRAVASGWLQLARSLLGDVPPESPVYAMLDSVEAALMGWSQDDVQRAAKLTAGALKTARAAGDRDTEMLVCAQLGLLEVAVGDASGGMSRVDQAAAAVLAGDVHNPEFAARICCFLLTACCHTQDVARALQWAPHVLDVVRPFTTEVMFAYPRAEHALLLMLAGEWPRAERMLDDVLTATPGRSRPAIFARLVLADLRRRQGRLDEARTLLNALEDAVGAHEGERWTSGVRAELELARDRPARAAELARQELRAGAGSHGPAGRADALAVLVRSLATLQRITEAGRVALELRGLAEDVGTDAVRATSDAAAGLLAARGKDRGQAVTLLERAVAGYARAGMPFEAASTRVELAATLLEAGDAAVAAAEAELSSAAFRALGAAREARRAAVVVGRCRSTGQATAGLTAREAELLRFLAEGLSNGEIAERLVLSVRTVERHVSNIYSKLGLAGPTARTAAAAAAREQGLL